LQGGTIQVPADLSSAAFFLVGATIARDADLMLEQVGVNPTRTGVIDILRLMGADLSLINPRDEGGEPVADIRVRTSRLRGIEIPKPLVPLAIDEFPVLFVAAACAEGVTVVKGAQELRYKESDRIQTMACGLRALGIHAQATEEGMIIEGGALTGGCIDSQGDHRVAMAFAIAALSASDPIEIRDCENINTSFPRFAEMAHGIGLDISVRSEG
jgi:3-phosphoshikimate 1-carboxyvinyltransferase